MSKPRRSFTAGTGVAPEKRRFQFFRSRTSESGKDDLEADEQSPNAAETPSLSPATPPSPFPSTSSEQSAPRAESVSSITSGSDDQQWRPRAFSSSGPLEQVLETDDGGTGNKIEQDGLPTYASATLPDAAVTYCFRRTSPFAMVLEHEEVAGHVLYHISVGVNIWMPSCTVTTVRRGAVEDGPIIAELELGIASSTATIQIGGRTKALNEVYFRKNVASRTRLYFTGTGQAIKWKLAPDVWNASMGATPLASFVPTPPRPLTLQPAGHRLADHLVVSLLILMREHLTPLAGMSGDAAQLFNYSSHYNYTES